MRCSKGMLKVKTRDVEHGDETYRRKFEGKDEIVSTCLEQVTELVMGFLFGKRSLVWDNEDYD